MKRIIYLIITILIAFITYNYFIKVNVIFNDNNILEINEEYTNKDFVKKVINGSILNEEDKVSFDKLGRNRISFKIKNIFNMKKNIYLDVDVKDTISPVIDYKKELSINENGKIDLLKDVLVTDNSKEEIKVTIEGKYNIKKAGTYKLKYVAEDSSKNKTEEDFTLIVKKVQTKTTKNSNITNNKYHIIINKTKNVAVVYNNSDNIVKTFVISAGKNTPVGTFYTSTRVETLALVHGVWGHYTVRIKGPYWFHSVPYYTKPSNGHWDNLETEEYNKLGSLASLGCIRLSTIDAKWIYDNIKSGTKVEIYESNELPSGVIKPTPIKIDLNSPNKGWDPTDPDPYNPWKN